MKRSQRSRRGFIKGVGIAGGLLLLKPSAFAQRIATYPCAQYTRKNIKNLTAAEMTALKNGVQVMKNRSAPTTPPGEKNDPTSWLYQADIHGTYTTPVQTAWNTCQHNLLFFLSWHRMYLYFFERILRAASGSASFALPYWNYFDAAARQIPLAYRSPANASNPLWESNRGAAMGGGGSLPASAVDHTAAFAYVPFNNFSPTLQGTPHNAVHSTIGGGMGFFELAGRDPVFWLHHCNIDRLWNRWISQGGGRTNPTGTPAWMNTMFTFFDETKTQVQMSGSQLVSTASQLKYCYDEEQGPFVYNYPDRFAARIKRLEILAASSKVELTAKTVRIALNLDDKARSEISKAISAAANDTAAPQLVLDFEGVEGKPPEGYFEVYINLPDGVKDPDYRSEYYAGNMSFFGLVSGHSGQRHEKLQFQLIITDRLRRLSAVKRLNNNNLTLTFVGRAAISPEGRQLPLSSDTSVRVERVTLSIE
jgi:tyrosinase